MGKTPTVKPTPKPTVTLPPKVPQMNAYYPGSTNGATYPGQTKTGPGFVPMRENGKLVSRKISDVINQVNNPSAFAEIANQLRWGGQVGKTTNDLKTIKTQWAYVVNAAANKGMNPFDYIQGLGPRPAASSNANGTTTYVTDYSGSKGQAAFQAAFNNVFGRNPIAGDQISPLKDAKGKPLTWIQALNQEAQKPGNAETVTRSGSNVVTKGGFDAQAWLQGQLADYYRKGIQTGTLKPEQSISTQYANLANDYGINVYDPTNKGFNTAARLDLAGLESKTTTLDQIKQNWANATVAKYGNLTPQIIQAGLTLRQVADPALKSMGSILGLDPNGISLNDPLVQQYIQGDGKSVMPQYQFEQVLRNDPRWSSSKDAQDTLGATAVTLAKVFGVMG